MDPSGQFIYVAEPGGNEVGACSINSTSSVLTLLVPGIVRDLSQGIVGVSATGFSAGTDSLRQGNGRVRAMTYKTMSSPPMVARGIGGLLGLLLAQCADAVLLRLVSRGPTPIPLDTHPDSTILMVLRGLYGVLSQLVGQRRREIGIRIALGATHRSLQGMILRRAPLVTIVGLAVGLVVSLAVGRLLRAFLFGVKPIDGSTCFAVAIVLMALSIAAALIPARTAARTDFRTALQ